MSDPRDATLSRAALVALVVGSMAGAGIFTLPAASGRSTGVLGAFVAWCIAGAGMLMPAFVFQTLSRRRPDCLPLLFDRRRDTGMKTRIAAACVAAVMAGCTVGPNYVRPTVDTPPAWRIDYTQAADVANTKWWEQFGDPVLNGLVEARCARTSTCASRRRASISSSAH